MAKKYKVNIYKYEGILRPSSYHASKELAVGYPPLDLAHAAWAKEKRKIFVAKATEIYGHPVNGWQWQNNFGHNVFPD